MLNVQSKFKQKNILKHICATPLFVSLILVKGDILNVDEMVKRYSQQSKWLFFLDKILESYLI